MTASAICADSQAPRRSAVTDSYEYDAYGNEFTVSGTTPNEMMYRGEQFDSDLGLYYLRARYYNPLTGRFMSRDPYDGKPADPKTLHKYLYADGNPVNAKDPTGRGALFEAALVYAFTIQRTAPAILAYTVTTCTLLKYADLLLDEDALAKSVITGEYPDGPDERDIFFDMAEQFCSQFE